MIASGKLKLVCVQMFMNELYSHLVCVWPWLDSIDVQHCVDGREVQKNTTDQEVFLTSFHCVLECTLSCFCLQLKKEKKKQAEKKTLKKNPTQQKRNILAGPLLRDTNSNTE